MKPPPMTSPVTVSMDDKLAAIQALKIMFARHRRAALDEAAEVANSFYDDDARASYLEASSDIADAILKLKETPDAK